MTAEVIVMNKEAVALAADSAVTTGNKIHDSANKLFTLRKEYPVGVMISHSSDFMGIPWETLVKIYRDHRLGDGQLERVEAYTSDFLEFIQSEQYCTAKAQNDQISRIALSSLNQIATNTKATIDSRFLQLRECSHETTNEIARQELERFRDFLLAQPDYEYHEFDREALDKYYADIIRQAITSIYGSYGISVDDTTQDLAYECVATLIFKKTPSNSHSVISVVGFGENEIFPSYSIMHIEGVIHGELKVFSRNSEDIDRHENGVLIQPMGQSDIFNRFMYGIDDRYRNFVSNYFREFCKQLDMPPEQAQQAVEEFNNRLRRNERDMFVDPIVRTVQSLPKTELASMAESLVSLTSIKRKVSDEQETVAGPIDVAVITKGDGFIWLKRKHYFSPDLNHHHRDLYFRRSQQ